jgi:hypothetical protein
MIILVLIQLRINQMYLIYHNMKDFSKVLILYQL